MFRCCVALFAFMLAASAVAQTRPASALFGARESVQQVDLSPSGRYVVYIAPALRRSAVALVVDLQGERRAVPILRSDGDPERLRWCQFVSDTRLICSIGGLMQYQGMLVPFRRLFAINADGSDIVQLGQRPSFDDARLRQVDGAILDWLPGDGGAVLMSRDYVPEGGVGDTRIYRRENGLGVDRVDVRTGRATSVIRPNRQANGFMTDGRGNVRIMWSSGFNQSVGEATSRTDYFYRPVGSDQWAPFGSYDSTTKQGMIPLAVDAAINSAYVLRQHEGRFALFRVRLDGAPGPELIYANPNVDVDDVVRMGRGGAVIGVTFAEEQRQTVYFDRDYQRIAATLSRALPQLPLINFVSSDLENRKIVVFAGSDADPGRYYVYDRTTRQLEELMLVRPELEGTRLAIVRAVTYPAADGASVPAYLTLPPGREGARGLPAILLPHGGPEARDEWQFDWLAQYFANLGYAVLQPNFRGSAGYGDDWLAQNGFRGWATSIGDVTAGARWLVAQGTADPQRLAIVGWSYGGYAALQSGVTEPELYKAIVAIAPVTDLALLARQYQNFTTRGLVRDFIGSGPHVQQGSPLRNVSRMVAPVLLFHGARDLNVDVVHSQQMDRALREAGKQSRLTVYEGLEHDLGDSTARIEMLEQIGRFLEERLGGR